MANQTEIDLAKNLVAKLINQGVALRRIEEPQHLLHEIDKWRDSVADSLEKLSIVPPKSHGYWQAIPHCPPLSVAPLNAVTLSIAQNNLRKEIDTRLKFLADVQNQLGATMASTNSAQSNKVFIVHGHDDGTREMVARFVEQLKLRPIILFEQANKGGTIIEKFVENSDVAFAVVLVTGDDVGRAKKNDNTHDRPRARQNVIFELGYFFGKLGCDRVCALCEAGIETPSDFDAIVYISLNDNGWRMGLAREMKAAGLPVDMNDAI